MIVKPCEFRANSNCPGKKPSCAKKGLDLLSRRHTDLSWLFLRRLTMGFLLNTNVISELMLLPIRIAAVGERHVCTSIIVGAELRYGAIRKTSVRLAMQFEAVLAAIDVLALETPVDSVYGELRARLERASQSIGANDLLIAAHALTLGHTWSPITSVNFRGSLISVRKLAAVIRAGYGPERALYSPSRWFR